MENEMTHDWSIVGVDNYNIFVISKSNLGEWEINIRDWNVIGHFMD